MNLKELLRENILNLKPYSSARDEFKGKASVYLDANESPYNHPYNRYPDPQQTKLKEQISKIKNIPAANIFLGNGSDEAIDLLFRAFCEPDTDNVVAIEPTYGMYRVCADINNIQYRTVNLNQDFDIEAYRVMDATNVRTKIIWLCSPNNPTGNDLNEEEILKLLHWFRGIVVIDEAYIDFASRDSYSRLLKEYPNLVILQTFSKAWANAGVRLGMAFASEEIIAVLNKIKYPYNVNMLTQQHISDMIKNDGEEQVKVWSEIIKRERTRLSNELLKLPMVMKVYPSDANFILVKMDGAIHIYNILVRKSIIVRDRSKVTLCNDCLRITVGTAEENEALMAEMRKLRY
ncbi:MAG: histidinol-phosphate transaminase [Paludibacteraceae bacterium]|nr:histidinol-phosphate transaminase [Paludibacteraceae bacterium]